MNKIGVLIVLFILAAPLMAVEPPNNIVINDFDESFQGFSFSNGGLLTAVSEDESLSDEIDFIFDLPNGLGMNNRELSTWFSGEALILDLGEVPLDENMNIPEDGFTTFLNSDEIITGHTYLIKTASAVRYGKIRITEVDSANSRLTFNWLYLDE